jgi:hypothetical protein
VRIVVDRKPLIVRTRGQGEPSPPVAALDAAATCDGMKAYACMTSTEAPPGIADSLAGFEIVRTSDGRPSRRKVRPPGPSNWRPVIRTMSIVRRSTQGVLTGSPSCQGPGPVTTQAGFPPRIGPTSSGRVSCAGLSSHWLGCRAPLDVTALITIGAILDVIVPPPLDGQSQRPGRTHFAGSSVSVAGGQQCSWRRGRVGLPGDRTRDHGNSTQAERNVGSVAFHPPP